ncbi:LysR substrate-binding domain-containing protein [Vibrio sp. FNV 38]|nr:LysR substrate-binding domain-containing protein [Vibrio sp. FNV 38]
MKHTQLRSFHTVAKLGSFAKAAEVLNLSQPTITAQVRDLEEQYNVVLLHRQRNNNRLTDIGKELYEQTKLIFSLQQRAKKLLTASGSLKVGQFNVGAVSPAAVLPLIERFKRYYPGININIRTGGSDQIRNGVLSGELEIGMLAYRDPNPMLVSTKVAEQPVVLVVPNDHKLSVRKSITLGELEGVKLVHRESGSTTRKTIEDELVRKGINTYSELEVDSREGVREASIYGLGVSYVGLHEFQPHPDITMVTISDLQIRSKSYLIHLKELEQLPVIKVIRQLTHN